MKIALGSDHGGYALKCDIIQLLEKLGHEYKDFGCYSTESCDYPDFGEAAARAVPPASMIGHRHLHHRHRHLHHRQQGEGHPLRLCGDPFSAEMTRRHNDANMLAMGAGIVGPNLAERIVDVFLSTEFEGGRHARRVGLMMDIEKE